MAQARTVDPLIGWGSDEQDRINLLVCQITDGFLRGDEKRAVSDVKPFEELLGNLLPQSDVFTRCVVAQKLAKRSDVPRSILSALLNDESSICEPLVFHSSLLSAQDITSLMERRDPILRSALLARADLSLAQRQALMLNIPIAPAQPKIDALSPMHELLARIKPLMVAMPDTETEAEAEKPAPPIYIELPRLRAQTPASFVKTATSTAPQQPILIDIPRSALPQIAATHPTPKSSTLLPQLVRAAVLRQNDELAAIFASELEISAVITKALLKDITGEALITACVHIGVPEDATLQIATLLYPNLTKSGERLFALRSLYRHFVPETTKRIVEAWGALPVSVQQKHQSVHSTAEPRQHATHNEKTAPVAAPVKSGELVRL